MQSRWDAAAAAECRNERALRVYSSRLLGADPELVLHGGGNTSLKIREPNLFGEEEEILYIKGSGSDLASIDESGFAPLRMPPLLRLAQLDTLSDAAMVNALRCALTNASAPTPSVETLLHAILPFPYVDHTHADALIAVMNAPDGEARVREIYGDTVVYIPYVMPGFELSRYCARLFPEQAHAGTIGMLLMHHGIFSFGTTARESYERMIALVSQAEEYLQRRDAFSIALPELPAPADPPAYELAALRRAISQTAGAPMLLRVDDDPQALHFARRPDVAQLANQGCATPDHIIRTRRVPLIGRDVAAYAEAYRAYFAANAGPDTSLQMLDPAPRVILDPAFGLATAGRTIGDVLATAQIYRHTVRIIERATRLGGWQALPAADLFAIEYWELEQAKLRRQPAPPRFAGEVALVTGAASGIGRACVAALRTRGAAVVALDINPQVEALAADPGVLGVRCDVTDTAQVAAALAAGVRAFGGVDMLILNAGIFPASRKIADMPLDEWQRTMRINLDANLALMRDAHPFLALAPNGGRVVVIGSKNVPAPGPGAAAYSAAKAALTQLARVAALEWGSDGIRVNVIHPNAVFDTGIWSDEVLASRAASYGLSVEAYKKNNLLRVEITSRDVAELAAEMCGPLFARTTGAQVPIDGGNDRVI
jgi:rhamnose utilization protein RhaD (predicted bifunctional aldolase and dehydrogenase)/NAD(P)-dependent dehydrogenase (short-subunit alcohol dehydrogenase family)